MSFYVYILRCNDDSLYTGTAADVGSRMREHFSGSSRSAKYVRSRGAKRLEAVWECEDKSSALRLEYRIKQLSRQEKLELLGNEKECPDGSGKRIMDLERFGNWNRE